MEEKNGKKQLLIRFIILIFIIVVSLVVVSLKSTTTQEQFASGSLKKYAQITIQKDSQ